MSDFETDPVFWAILVGAVLIGGMLGWLLRGLRESIELRQLRNAHRQYRRDVTEHFRETAQLVGQLTEDYRAVYRHLANGAERLADGQADTRGLRDERLLSHHDESR